MIRINLVGEARRPVAARPSGRESGGGFDGESHSADWALLALTLIGLAVAGGHILYMNHQISKKNDQIAEAQAEVDRLEPIIREVQAFKEKKARLEHKLQVISDLKANQVGPVEVMDKVSRALPQLLWLNNMQVGNDQIRLTGEAFNTNAVSQLIENLDRLPEFREPVLRDTSRRGPNGYSFVLEARYVSPAVLRRQQQQTAETTAGGS